MIELYIGLIGSGKTTIAAKLSRDAIKKGRNVYTNVPEIDGVHISLESFGNFEISNGLLIFDEAGIDLNNRRYKETSRAFIECMKLSRHYKLDCAFFSQALDIDVTVPRLASRAWVVRGGLVLSSMSLFRPSIEVDEVSGQLMTKWKKMPQVPFLYHKWVFRPAYYQFFNSWRKPEELPPVPELARWRELHFSRSPDFTFQSNFKRCKAKFEIAASFPQKAQRFCGKLVEKLLVRVPVALKPKARKMRNADDARGDRFF